MRINEAAAILGVSRAMVNKAVLQGRMPATRNGHAWSITPEGIEHYRAHHRIGRTATCGVCGADFTTRGGMHSRYCSSECGQTAARAVSLGHAPNTPKDGYWYVFHLNCQHCGKRFQRKGGRSKYCSTKCRVAAFYLRHGTTPNEYMLRRYHARKAT